MNTKEKTIVEDTPVAEESHEEIEESYTNSIFNMTRNVVRANIGAVAMAYDEIGNLSDEVGNFTNKLIERGEKVEEDVSNKFNNIREQSQGQVEEVEDELGDKISDMMSRMAIPTKYDIRALSAKITTLTKKVDKLQAA